MGHPFLYSRRISIFYSCTLDNAAPGAPKTEFRCYGVMLVKIIDGVCGSGGYACGFAAVKRAAAGIPEKRGIQSPGAEERRFRAARAACEAHFEKLLQDSGKQSPEAGEIFGAYLTIARDEVFFQKALARLKPEQVNIEYLLYDECQKVLEQFAAFDDRYLRERAADIENVVNELISILLGEKQDFAAKIRTGEDFVAVAEDITPSEIMELDKSRLRGVVTEKGGATSHTVILAKAMEIPFIVGARGTLAAVSDGDFLLVDAFAGTVTVNPDERQKAAFRSRSGKLREEQGLYGQGADKPAVTRDGHIVHVHANTGEDLCAFDFEKCDGIGLLRTEFLYMNHDGYPGEEAQYEIYGGLVKRAGGKPVVIRTLDVGGDKQAGYMNLPTESNPFLGLRGIRVSLARREMFHAQLRAILRASARGNVKIMFPMIVSIEELRQAKECLKEAKQSLLRDGAAFSRDIPAGIMIETPAAVLISEKLARESDFFSIGTNDLIQYVTAADRMNEHVRHLYDSCNLSVLNAVRMAALSAEKASIPWGVCGEAASEDRLVPVWAALGASELSVAPSLVGRVKHLLRQTDKSALLPEIEGILGLDCAEDVKTALDGILARM